MKKVVIDFLLMSHPTARGVAGLLFCLLLSVGCGMTPTHKGRWVHLSSKPTDKPIPTTGKRLFVVIDDGGLVFEETEQFLHLPMPLTIAVLPHQKQTDWVVDAIRKHPGKEMILHQPMEATGGNNPGPGAIYNDTDPADVPRILSENHATVPGVVGMNNHMGSRTTENEAVMAAVLRYCRENGLFFLDSKTAYNSVVSRVAAREGMHVEERHVFLDIQHDREGIQRAWDSTVAKADEHGYAIAIGHVWSTPTADVLRDSYDDLIKRGFTFHLLSELYP